MVSYWFLYVCMELLMVFVLCVYCLFYGVFGVVVVCE